MQREEQASESKFKVVDRRRFDEEGQERDVEDKKVNEPFLETKPSASEKVPPVQERKEEAKSLFTFSVFVQSLAHQALMAMGLVPWPDSGLIKQQLDHARETIDILVMLQEKTKGNLSLEEKKMFDTLLYELRMTFVQVLQGNVGGPLNPPPAN